MQITKTSKIVAAAVGFTLALTVLVGGASATNAQTMTLSQLVDLFISLGIISPDKAAAAKAAVTSTVLMSYNRDLTVGSSGVDVTALQREIGVSPATGYFGSITKAAVQAYQASKGIITTGYVGPLTRAALNASVTTTTTTTTTTGGTTSTTVINSGVEGTLTASKASISNSTVREGNTMKTLLGVKLEAKLSDINIQRVKVNLGTSTSIYTKVFKTLYLTDDAGNVLAQADLNSNTVVKDTDSIPSAGSTAYALTFGGFSYNVPKNSTKYLWIKGDVYSSIKVADQYTRTIALFGTQAVRGVDGAGIDQYAGTNAISQSLSLGTDIAESASIKLSANASNYKSNDVVAASGSDEDEADMVPVLAFDLKADKDNMLVTDIRATIAKTGTGAATATKAYLFDGSTQIDSEDINATTGIVLFDDIDLSVSKDSTKVLTIKVDVVNANGTASVITASVTAAQVIAENSLGTEKSSSGSATGEAFTVRNAGPVFSLQSKTISVSGTNQSGSTLATSTVQAKFVINVTAVGGDITFGTQASTSASRMFVFKTYNAAGSEVIFTTASSTGFPVPDGALTAAPVGSNSFKLPENTTKTITVTLDLPGKDAAGNPIAATAVAIEAIRWTSNDGGLISESTFMAGKTEWRTDTRNP